MSAARLGPGVDYLVERYPDEPEVRAMVGAAATVDPVAGGRIMVVGTVAGHVARSPQLRLALEEAGLRDWVAEEAGTVEECAGRPDWDLAVILSPYKQVAVAICDDLSPTAAGSGVVDTLVRRGDQVLGVATNSFAIEAVVHRLVPPLTTSMVQIVGTGATARCAVAAVRRCCPDAPIGLSGRSTPRVAAMAKELAVTALPAAARVEMTIHATTWGETEESEHAPLVPDVAAMLTGGQVLFDLNNRVSALQVTALGHGCVVVGGRFMQRLVHIQRAWMLRLRLMATSDNLERGRGRWMV